MPAHGTEVAGHTRAVTAPGAMPCRWPGTTVTFVTSQEPPPDARGAFDAPAGAWNAVSPRLATAWRIVLAGFLVLPAAAVVLLALRGSTVWSLSVGGLSLGLFAWGWWLIGRRVHAYGYAERSDDLLVVSGILFRRLVVVPYGRMQLVDLSAGPLDRLFGMATVQLHTAAATTDATIPGLPDDRAVALRDRLAARGEQRSAGL